MRASPTLPARAAAGPAVVLRREPLDCRLGPAEVLAALSGRPFPFALTGAWAGGGSIVSSDPLVVAEDRDDPFAILDELPTVAHDDDDELSVDIREQSADDAFLAVADDAFLAADTRDQIPAEPVGGGWFGWLGYRLGARIERIPPGPPRPVELPDFHLAYYDNVLRLDRAGNWWFEALVSERRRGELDDRLDWLRALLSPSAAATTQHRTRPTPPPPLELPATAAAHHLDAVASCRRRIAAGEIFQANICLRLETDYDGNAGDLLSLALERTAPPYAAAFRTPRGELASLSPELFLRRRGSLLTTAPIKGTIERDADDPVAARRSLAQLRGSAKDAAEHVMIVDLMRNDLGRVCRYGSVRAELEPTAEPHPGLWHLVSHVDGITRPEVGNGDVLRATFPPGSVAGAPKVQALHVIADLERTGREIYTGAIGYASPLAGLELNVAIRTLELRDGRLWLGAGGGIVADSDPETELAEAIAKARSVASAIGSAVRIEDRA